MPPLSPELDASFGEGARTLRGAAWDRLVRQVFDTLREPVYAVCLHITARRSDAEDALQETFLAVYLHGHTFRGDSQFSTWVYRIAVRAAWVAKRRRRAEGPLEGALSLEDGSPRPDDLTAAREDASRLHRALSELSEEQRTVLALFAVDGLSHEQIAAVMGVPTGTIWSRLHTARKRLGEAMAIRVVRPSA